MDRILRKLEGGDLRSIGRSGEVVEDVLNDPQLFSEVFDGMLSDDPVVRMRAADAVEKVSRQRPEFLQPFKFRLLNEVSKVTQQEVRWHLAQMFSYLDLSKDERDSVVEILCSFIDTEKSKIVKTFSMQTLTDLAERDETIRPRVRRKIEHAIETGSPAMVNKGEKLLKRLKRA